MRQRLAFPNFPGLPPCCSAEARNNAGKLSPSGAMAPILSMARRVIRPALLSGDPLIWNIPSPQRILVPKARSECASPGLKCLSSLDNPQMQMLTKNHAFILLGESDPDSIRHYG